MKPEHRLFAICMVGSILMGIDGVYVKHFNLGWLELNQDFGGYEVTGAEPGKLNISSGPIAGTCPITNGEFNC